MKTTDVLKGKITLEVTDYGIAGDCQIAATTFGKAILFDAFLKAMKMYNPMDQLSMIAIISEGGLEKLLGDKCDCTVVDLTKLDEIMKEGK